MTSRVKGGGGKKNYAFQEMTFTSASWAWTERTACRDRVSHILIVWSTEQDANTCLPINARDAAVVDVKQYIRFVRTPLQVFHRCLVAADTRLHEGHNRHK
jgi:hypothetical protein